MAFGLFLLKLSPNFFFITLIPSKSSHRCDGNWPDVDRQNHRERYCVQIFPEVFSCMNDLCVEFLRLAPESDWAASGGLC